MGGDARGVSHYVPPFCRDRDGMILGEGGAMLVLEPLEAAQARGARIYAEMVGFGMSSDASHITHPSTKARRWRCSGRWRRGSDPAQVGYINAHGTATDVNDPTETARSGEVFGSHPGIPVSSTKSMHGHALGAAARWKRSPPCSRCITASCRLRRTSRSLIPACQLDVIANEARQAEVEYAISNSFAFGGLNATLVFRQV